MPTAVAGWMPNSSTSSGVINDPPPTPVKPTSMPTTETGKEYSGWIAANMDDMANSWGEPGAI